MKESYNDHGTEISSATTLVTQNAKQQGSKTWNSKGLARKISSVLLNLGQLKFKLRDILNLYAVV